MNESIPQPGQDHYQSNPAKPKWREAIRCETNTPPSYPDKKPHETIREKDTKETYFLMNTASSGYHHSGSVSKLAWILFGLAALLFLGSLLSNLLMVWTFARATESTNNSKEVITTTTTREVVRVNDSHDRGDYHYYAPAARW